MGTITNSCPKIHTQRAGSADRRLCGPRFFRTPGCLHMPARTPTATDPPAHPDFTALRFIPDAFAVPNEYRPRQPASGSELSFMLFRNLSPLETMGNFPVALAQYFTGNTGLRRGINVSAFPLPSPSDPSEEVLFGA